MRDTVSGAGAVADFGSHSLDMATWMLEAQCGPLVQIYGSLGTFVKRQNEYPTNDDMAIVTGRFASGALLSILDSRVGPGAYQVEVLAANGYAAFDIRNPKEVSVRWYAEEHPDIPSAGDDDLSADPFAVQLGLFLTAIENGDSVQPDFRTAYKVQRLIDTVCRSSV